MAAVMIPSAPPAVVTEDFPVKYATKRLKEEKGRKYKSVNRYLP
jgi:hypothetical protein